MDPRLIALMQMAQRAKQPVRRFSDGDLIDDGLSSGVQELIGDMSLPDMNFSNPDFAISDLDIASSLGDIGNLISDDMRAGMDFGGEDNILSKRVNIDDPGSYKLLEPLRDVGSIDNILERIGDTRGRGWAEGEIEDYLGGPIENVQPVGTQPYFPFAANDGTTEGIQDLINQLYDTRADETGYGNLISASEEAERADRYGGLYEQAMSGLTDAMQGGVYNAARDSQAANEYLERVMGVPRSEIDEAYRTQVPRYVNLSNFEGGKSFTTGVAPPGTKVPDVKPGTEVKYDSKGNIVDTKTGTILDKAPPGTTTKTIQDIIKQYTGATQTGAKTGQQSNLASLLPLLLMMLMMNRQSGGTSNASIPALSASQTQTPYGAIQQAAGYRPGQGGITYFNPIQYAPKMAGGGIADLAMMKQGGRLLHGPGDGVSDSIPATIGGQQPARLARGEYVIDARTVAELGNGSTDAGAERLDEMRQRVLSKRKQAKMGQDTRAYKHLPA